MPRRLTRIEAPRPGNWRRRRLAAQDRSDPVALAEAVLRVGGLLRSRLRAIAATEDLPVDVVELVLLFTSRVSYRPTDIAAHLACSRSAASRLVARAESHGLVERRPAIFDDRALAVQMTTRGRALLQRVQAALRAGIGPGSQAAVASLAAWAADLTPPCDPCANAATSSKWRTTRSAIEFGDC